jgi:hypothetical protein
VNILLKEDGWIKDEIGYKQCYEHKSSKAFIVEWATKGVQLGFDMLVSSPECGSMLRRETLDSELSKARKWDMSLLNRI